MDANVKTKWIKALRSGEYKQGTGRLFNGDSYCCLGVLCRVTDTELVSSDNTRIIFHVKDNESMTGELPIELLEKLGMSQDEQQHLIDLNDGQKDFGTERHSFNQIADWIEKNL